jgi:hypothetical protein
MTIEITGAAETPATDPPDVLQQGGVQMQDQACDTTVLITEAQVALGTASARVCDGRTVGGLRY